MNRNLADLERKNLKLKPNAIKFEYRRPSIKKDAIKLSLLGTKPAKERTI